MRRKETGSRKRWVEQRGERERREEEGEGRKQEKTRGIERTRTRRRLASSFARQLCCSREVEFGQSLPPPPVPRLPFGLGPPLPVALLLRKSLRLGLVGSGGNSRAGHDGCPRRPRGVATPSSTSNPPNCYERVYSGESRFRETILCWLGRLFPFFFLFLLLAE